MSFSFRTQKKIVHWLIPVGVSLVVSACIAEEKKVPNKPKDATKQNEEKGFVPLFDGQSFDGWEGNLDSFRIEEKAIVGGSMKEKVPRNEFLATKKDYADFELRLEFKLLGKGANAGVQIRSRRIPNHHDMIGYQADLGDGWWGCLYDESRRKKVLAGPPGKERGKIIKPNEWNEYRIRCEGRRIQLWINDHLTVDYTETDDSIEQTGLIALQIHGGPPTEAWYRAVRIRVLEKEESEVDTRKP